MDFAVQLHFGMAGNIQCSTLATDAADPVSIIVPQGRKAVSGYIVLFDSTTVIHLIDTTVRVVSLRHVESAESKKDRDITAEHFAFSDALQLLKADGRIVQDAIMDQDILPGVGNVIKCEGLAYAMISPFTNTSSIPEQRLRLLLQRLHDFARRWMECCRKRRQIEKRVYGRTSCLSCEGAVTLIRSTQDARITYFCGRCQNEFGSCTAHLPTGSVCGGDALITSFFKPQPAEEQKAPAKYGGDAPITRFFKPQRSSIQSAPAERRTLASSPKHKQRSALASNEARELLMLTTLTLT